MYITYPAPMNYCTRCGSYYTQPGTCNCFAGPRTISVPFAQTECAACRDSGICGCYKSGTITTTGSTLGSNVTWVDMKDVKGPFTLTSEDPTPEGPSDG